MSSIVITEIIHRDKERERKQDLGFLFDHDNTTAVKADLFGEG